MSTREYGDNYILDEYSKSIKTFKKSIRNYKWWIGVAVTCAFFFGIFLPIFRYVTGHWNWWQILNIVSGSCWCFNVWIYRRNIKKARERVVEYQNKYDEELKSIDYPEYVRQKRKKKLERVLGK